MRCCLGTHRAWTIRWQRGAVRTKTVHYSAQTSISSNNTCARTSNFTKEKKRRTGRKKICIKSSDHTFSCVDAVLLRMNTRSWSGLMPVESQDFCRWKTQAWGRTYRIVQVLDEREENIDRVTSVRDGWRWTGRTLLLTRRISLSQHAATNTTSLEKTVSNFFFLSFAHYFASACYPPLSVTPQNTASHSVTNRGYVSTQDHKIPQICHVTIFLFLCY